MMFSAVFSNFAAASLGSKSKNWSDWKEVGNAQLSVLFFDVYRSQLLTPSGRYQQGEDITPHPLALSINYQRDISQRQLIKATQEQWEKLGYLETAEWVAQLESIFPDIERGHNLTYVTDGVVGRFFHSSDQGDKNQLIGVVNDPHLNDAFLAIWLSPDSDYPRLRRQLIGE
ncbi:chalcone isomerase family protein [Vibrio ostreicida]|uniref:Chalcone isomerase family protein n=2 Tax=Vibrio ostreicida TaxID=526588 RepID=A0ABT8BTC1_9VIBR|nr:chalcone isomerase family protein [Vibrio ostreicida]MDN3609679.1 chalcone isomerase family protein [Vibrio ostreicida]NPD09489.1 hypothetical protein [Vibrio ostreicida]